jgi:hypothetical protein
MASIKAYTFTTEAEAQQAIDLINVGEGIPVSEDSVTRTYTNFQTAEDTYYIAADEVTEKYLGEATDLELPETTEI